MQIQSATPKYDKKEVPAENYSVTNNNDGTYTLKLKQFLMMQWFKTCS